MRVQQWITFATDRRVPLSMLGDYQKRVPKHP